MSNHNFKELTQQIGSPKIIREVQFKNNQTIKITFIPKRISMHMAPQGNLC
jgi:hypothetical protein